MIFIRHQDKLYFVPYDVIFDYILYDRRIKYYSKLFGISILHDYDSINYAWMTIETFHYHDIDIENE